GSDAQTIEQLRSAHRRLRQEIGKIIVGQELVLDQLLMAIFCRGHALLMGVPGLAKTLMVSTLAQALDLSFKRIQFTPDLMPSDVTGTEVIQDDPATKQRMFKFLPGPIFANIVLADEINRTPPKTQAALLEAMQERKVSIGGVDYPMPEPFFVLATQNPIEQEGTYPLPEAQLDRFMVKTSVGQPSLDEETEILNRRNTRGKDDFDVAPVMSPQQLVAIQKAVEQVHMDPAIVRYIAQVIVATRTHPDVQAGASPRGSLALMKLAKSQAALRGRPFVVPDDVRELVQPVLAHRILLKPEPRIRGVTT